MPYTKRKLHSSARIRKPQYPSRNRRRPRPPFINRQSSIINRMRPGLYLWPLNIKERADPRRARPSKGPDPRRAPRRGHLLGSEAANLIDLESLAGPIHHDFVMVSLAGLADVSQQLDDSALWNTRCTDCGPDRTPIHKSHYDTPQSFFGQHVRIGHCA